jgi:hypothetical protein
VAVVEFDKTLDPTALAAIEVTNEFVPTAAREVAVAIVGVPSSTSDKFASVG